MNGNRNPPLPPWTPQSKPEPPVAQPPSFVQGEQGTMTVPIPGMGGVTLEVPRGTPPEVIAQQVDAIREERQAELQPEQAPAFVRHAPEALSLAGQVGGTVVTRMPKVGSTVGATAGHLLGRGIQRGYESAFPPIYQIPGGPEVQTAPLPLSGFLKELALEAPIVAGTVGATEAIVPKLGPAAAFLGSRYGVKGPVQYLKERGAGLLYPEKGAAETKDMLAIDERIRKTGAPGLNIAQLGGEEKGVIARGAHGVASLSPQMAKQEAATARGMQQYVDQWQRQHGFPDSKLAAENLRDLIDGAEEATIGRVQNAAYGFVRRSIPLDARIVPADKFIMQLRQPQSQLNSYVVAELRKMQSGDPKVVGALQQFLTDPQGFVVPGLTFDESITMRTALFNVYKRFGGSQDPAAASLADDALHLGTQFSKDIKKSVLRIHPQAGRELIKADNKVANIKDIFTNKDAIRFRRQLEEDPQQAMELFKRPREEKGVNVIKAMIDPYRAKKGTGVPPPEWKDVREWVAGDLIRESMDVTKKGQTYFSGAKLSAALNRYKGDEQTINAIFGSSNTWNELRLMARGLEAVEREPSGFGRIAISLKAQAAVGAVAGGTAMLPFSQRPEDVAMGAAGGAALLLSPQVIGSVLTNPSLLKHFREGIWEYRQLGVIGPKLRAAIRNAEAQVGYHHAIPATRDYLERRQTSQGLPEPPVSRLQPLGPPQMSSTQP